MLKLESYHSILFYYYIRYGIQVKEDLSLSKQRNIGFGLIITLIIANTVFIFTALMVTYTKEDISQRVFISIWALVGNLIILSIGFMMFDKKIIIISTLAMNVMIISLVWDVLIWPYVIRLPIYLFIINMMIIILLLMMKDLEKQEAELNTQEE